MKIAKELRDAGLVVPIDSITPAKANPRRGDIVAIRESLRVNGQFRPVVVNRKTGEILAGNHTWRAAKEEGATEIARTLVTATPEQAKRILIADNRTSDLAVWDTAELAELLKGLPDYSGTGYTPTDVDRLLAEEAAKVEDPPAPAPPKRPKTKLGDVIQLGRHRLVCGDATDQGAWDALMDGQRQIDLVWTDPPYGVDVAGAAKARGGRAHSNMKGDGKDAAALEQLIAHSLGFAAANARPGCPIYVCHADTMRGPVGKGMHDAGWRHSQTLVWVKDSLVIGRQDYQWRHEAILYGWLPGADRTWLGARNKNTVIETLDRASIEALDHPDLVDIVQRLLEDRPGTVVRVGKVRDQGDHPTPKPVDLVLRTMRNSADAGAVVADPFGGSGTTLLAAEQSDRQALLIELEPGYCDVIVARWEELSGEKAERPKRGRR